MELRAAPVANISMVLGGWTQIIIAQLVVLQFPCESLYAFLPWGLVI